MSDEGPDLPEESESYTNWFVSTLSAHPPVRTTLSTLPGLNEKDPQVDNVALLRSRTSYLLCHASPRHPKNRRNASSRVCRKCSNSDCKVAATAL